MLVNFKSEKKILQRSQGLTSERKGRKNERESEKGRKEGNRDVGLQKGQQTGKQEILAYAFSGGENTHTHNKQIQWRLLSKYFCRSVRDIWVSWTFWHFVEGPNWIGSEIGILLFRTQLYSYSDRCIYSRAILCNIVINRRTLVCWVPPNIRKRSLQPPPQDLF